MSPWHTSSYSDGAHNCVEVAEGPLTGFRDTRHRDAARLTVPAPEWAALINALRIS